MIASTPFLSFLSLTLTIPTFAAALPANPPAGSQTFTETLSPHNLTALPAFLYKPTPPFKTSRQPTLSNCAAAMRGFPADSELAHFHNSGAGDGYQLPLFQRYKDYSATIEDIGNDITKFLMLVNHLGPQVKPGVPNDFLDKPEYKFVWSKLKPDDLAAAISADNVAAKMVWPTTINNLKDGELPAKVWLDGIRNEK
ncbi:MAG: hypothetical protein Q9202_003382 [Teloschistes flavicans]